MKKILFILIILLGNLAMSQNNIHTTTIQPTIDVMGEGIVKVTPDEVTIKVQVEHKGQNPKELKQKNDFIINDVLAFIKSMNIADKQVQTEFVRLNKNYDYQTKTYNYLANQSVSIYLKDLKIYESLILACDFTSLILEVENEMPSILLIPLSINPFINDSYSFKSLR